MPSPHRYLINFLLDATVGMLLIYLGVRAVSILVEWQQWESLRFGEYGNVPWTLAGQGGAVPRGAPCPMQLSRRVDPEMIQELVALSSVVEGLVLCPECHPPTNVRVPHVGAYGCSLHCLASAL